MPKVSPIQTSFNAGEFSPMLYGRVDSDRYKAALKVCLNMLPTVQGALTRRPGTSFVASVKYPAKFTRLMPFQFSTTQAYILEFGDLYVRFYKNNGLITLTPTAITGITNANPGVVTATAHGLVNGDRVIIDGVRGMSQLNSREFTVAGVTTNTFQLSAFNTSALGVYTLGGTVSKIYEVVTQYSEADLPQVKYTQSADTFYLVHPNYPPQKLLRFAHTDWSLQVIEFVDGPYLPLIDASSPSPNGPKLNFVDSSTIPGSTPYIAVATSVGTVAVTGAINDPSTGQIILTAPMFWAKTGDTITVSAVGGTTNANGFWTVKRLSATQFLLLGSVYNAAYTSGGTVKHSFFKSNQAGSPFRVRLDGESTYRFGSVRAGPFADGSVDIFLSGAKIATTTQGQLYRFGPWATGYPASVTFHEDRLVFGGPREYPQRIDFSASGDYERFSPSDLNGTVVASSALAISLNSSSVDVNRWLSSDEKGLLAGSVANEWVIKGSSIGDALSPTNVSAKRVSAYGSADVQPIQVGKSTLYIQVSSRKIRELLYFYDVDGFRANDMTALSEHITGSGLRSIAYQKEPQSIMWAPRNDGILTSMTYDRDVDSVKAAWARHSLGGYGNAAGAPPKVEAVACIPSPDGTRDELWLIAKRWIKGAYVRYVEYITPPFDSVVPQRNAFFVDSGLTYDAPISMALITKANPAVVTTAAAHGFLNGDKVLFSDLIGMSELENVIGVVTNKTTTTFEIKNTSGVNIDSTLFSIYVEGGSVRKMITTISGFNHLEGETVAVLVDGATHPDVVVTNGIITLNVASAVVNVGYRYNSDLQILRIDAGSANGTSIGKTRRIQRFKLMLHRTLGVQFGMSFAQLDTAIFRNANNPGERSTPLYSGIWLEEIEGDYDTENQICLRQSDPLPFTILALMSDMDLQDGQ